MRSAGKGMGRVSARPSPPHKLAASVGPAAAACRSMWCNPLLRLPTPGFAVQGVSRDPRGEAAVDELCRQAQRLTPRLVFEVPDELLAEAESRVPGEHVGTKVWGNILGAP